MSAYSLSLTGEWYIRDRMYFETSFFCEGVAYPLSSTDLPQLSTALNYLLNSKTTWESRLHYINSKYAVHFTNLSALNTQPHFDDFSLFLTLSYQV